MEIIFYDQNYFENKVVEAAATKPFGFMKFTPGPGLGGHCIPIDPFYLTWKAREYGQHTRFIELAGEINGAISGFIRGQALVCLILGTWYAYSDSLTKYRERVARGAVNGEVRHE